MVRLGNLTKWIDLIGKMNKRVAQDVTLQVFEKKKRIKFKKIKE